MKRIVIIGASSGIGRQVAIDFARMGWRVGIAARREEPLREIREEFPALVDYRLIDVTSDNAGEEVLKLAEQVGGMDVLLYSSGVGYLNPELDEDKDIRTVETNCVGFVRIINAAYGYFKVNSQRGKAGHIAAITSIAGTKGLGLAASYSASKRFGSTYLDALSQLAHQEGVNVTFGDIRPGFIATPLLSGQNKFPMIMTLEHAVTGIERAILKRKRVAVIDWKWRMVTAAWRMIPMGIWRRMKLNVKKVK